jgi:RNA polymerase sigma-70 factor (ECF subfamily)
MVSARVGRWEGGRVPEALVEQAGRGDAEAFDALARRVGDQCMAIAQRILRDRDAAEEAVQATLITAWRELRTLREAERFEPWLHRILVRTCYKEARRSRRWSNLVQVLSLEPTRDPRDDLRVEDRDQLERAFRRLTPEQRAVLVFRHYLDLPVADVADHLGIPIGTVKSRLHFASEALRASVSA